MIAPKILVVDDGKVIRLVIKRKLQEMGYEVTAVAGGREALEAIEKDMFDLVLLDVSMPEISGMEVLVRIRKTHSATWLPVIMVTANEEDEDVIRAFDLGASDYVTKPIKFPVLRARIKTQIKLKMLNEELENFTSEGG